MNVITMQMNWLLFFFFLLLIQTFPSRIKKTGTYSMTRFLKPTGEMSRVGRRKAAVGAPNKVMREHNSRMLTDCGSPRNFTRDIAIPV
jgi:hypothetical protein